MQSSGYTTAGERTVNIEGAIARMSLDNWSAYQSQLTDGTGKQSQIGSRWRQDLTLTMQSGFAAGTPRSGNYKGAREGRERGRWLPRVMGVGRTGKGPAPVPVGMLKALGVKVDQEDDIEVSSETAILGLPRQGSLRPRYSEVLENFEPTRPHLSPKSSSSSLPYIPQQESNEAWELKGLLPLVDLFSSEDWPSSEKWIWTPLKDNSSEGDSRKEHAMTGTSAEDTQQHFDEGTQLRVDIDRGAQTGTLTPRYTDQAEFQFKYEWLRLKQALVVTLSMDDFWDEEFANALKNYYDALQIINDGHQLGYKYHDEEHHEELYHRGLTLELSYLGVMGLLEREFDEKVLGEGVDMRRRDGGAAVHMAPALKIEKYRTSLELLREYMDGGSRSVHIRQADLRIKRRTPEVQQ